jgi:protocatechuate 3,4-dioxygenase beta subunit
MPVTISLTRSFAVACITMLFSNCGSSQEKQAVARQLAGGACEGCEAVFEYGNKHLTAIDTLPDYNEKGPKIKVTGTVYQPDGKTPAKDVIVYVYHTDQQGIYAEKGNETGWGKLHGYIRGWVKTGDDGKYTFYTLKPGIYPQRNAPAHIHSTLFEPGGKYYWIEEYYFEGDTLLTEKEINPAAPRGGTNGVLSFQNKDGIAVGERDIILGRNISGY